MLAQGTPLHVVSEILGHASITITKDVYGHLAEGDRRAVAASMGRYCSAPNRAPWLPAWLPQARKDPSPERVGACDLGALGGTRTPNLLIRSKITVVQCCLLSSGPAGSFAPSRRADPATSRLIQLRC